MADVKCSFCGKGNEDVGKLFSFMQPQLVSFSVMQNLNENTAAKGTVTIQITPLICKECVLKCCATILGRKTPGFRESLKELLKTSR